jgi:putative hydrolase of the HAD superfamily
MIDAIAFDADDTLWHTEVYYREVEDRFTAMLNDYRVSPETSLAALHRIEVENLACFGYGIRGFTLSMIEAAVQVTGGKVRGTDVQCIIDFGRGMMTHEIRLLDGVVETLTSLKSRRLLLITKGDTLDQESKVQRSGLSGYFQSIEIVIDKNQSAYTDLFSRYAIDPAQFLMVGNSLRSDIAPVLALGAYAVYVPYPLTWAHETDADLPEDTSRYFEIQSLRELPGLIDRIEKKL